MRTFLTAILLLVTAVPPSHAVTCTIDTLLPTAAAGDQAIGHINLHKCLLDLMRTRSKATMRSEAPCTTVTVSAASRQLVTVNTSTALIGTEVVAFAVQDFTAPYLTVPDGSARATSGNSIIGYVFNQDGQAARTVRVCPIILRP